MGKIVLIVESLGSGGAERQLTGLAILLKKAGYNVEVWYYIDKDFFLPVLSENNVPTKFISGTKSSIQRFFRLFYQIKQDKPEVVISYSPLPSMAACMLKLLKNRFRLIVSERSITRSSGFRSNLRFFCYRWSDYIVPNSYTQKKYIEDHFPKLSAKVKVITNFVDTELFKPDERTIVDDKTHIICVGTIGVPKNIIRFIEAIAQIIKNGKDVYVDWYGKDLGDEYSKETHEKVRYYGLEDRIIFHSPKSGIQEEYNKADVFCLPSIYEGYPNVLCEAMSCGLPVVCSKVSDIPQIIIDGENGLLFDPQNINEMVDVIQQYLELPQTMKEKMGIKSREIAVELFSKEKFLNDYLVLLSEHVIKI